MSNDLSCVGELVSSPYELNLSLKVVMEDDRSSSPSAESRTMLSAPWVPQMVADECPVSSPIPANSRQLTESAVRMTARPSTSLESTTYERYSHASFPLCGYFAFCSEVWDQEILSNDLYCGGELVSSPHELNLSKSKLVMEVDHRRLREESQHAIGAMDTPLVADECPQCLRQLPETTAN